MANIFEKALEQLDEKGWAQENKNLNKYKGPICAVLALAMASETQTGKDDWGAVDGPARMAYLDALGKLKQRLGLLEDGSIPNWNDDPFTSEEDVRLAFKVLAAEEEL